MSRLIVVKPRFLNLEIWKAPRPSYNVPIICKYFIPYPETYPEAMEMLDCNEHTARHYKNSPPVSFSNLKGYNKLWWLIPDIGHLLDVCINTLIGHLFHRGENICCRDKINVCWTKRFPKKYFNIQKIFVKSRGAAYVQESKLMPRPLIPIRYLWQAIDLPKKPQVDAKLNIPQLSQALALLRKWIKTKEFTKRIKIIVIPLIRMLILCNYWLLNRTNPLMPYNNT